MVRFNGEVSADEVEMELLHSKDDGRSFFLLMRVMFLRCRQGSGDVCNGPFFTTINDLRQDGPDTII